MTKGRRPAKLPAMITNSLEVTLAERAGAQDAEPAIAVRGLRKAYGDLQALAGVDLTVHRGEVLAVLGPNGAGKTTLVEILEGHRRADSGEVRVLGHDPGLRERDFRARIGIVLQETGVEELLTVGEAIALYSAAYPNPRPAAEAAELVGLGDRMDVRAGKLSGGQRRRLDLAIALAGNPELIFLDEPTTGFDPAARRQSWELIASLRELGTTILLTTHYMDEAQHLADRVVVVREGRVIADGPPESLGAETPLAVVSYIDASGARVSFRTATPTADLASLIAGPADRGEELEGLTVTRPSLEDVYLELTA
jgi:ABC-2 type transport system ATP-binding protein